MHRSFVALIVLALAVATMASTSFEVKAKENSISGGSALNTEIPLWPGDRLTVSVDVADYWSAGSGAERLGNADGLTSKSPYTAQGATFLFGTLVGRFGSGPWLKVGTNFDQVLDANVHGEGGRLQFAYWDSNNADNSGEVTAAVEFTRMQVGVFRC